MRFGVLWHGLSPARSSVNNPWRPQHSLARLAFVLLILLCTTGARAVPSTELRYGPSLRLTAEYVNLMVLNRADRALKRDTFDFIIASPGVSSNRCPTERVLLRTSWTPGTDLLLPKELGETHAQGEILLKAPGEASVCSSRGILNFDARQIVFTLDTEEGAFQYRTEIASMASNVLRLPYIEEMNLVSPRARCEATVIDGPNAVVPPLKAGQGSCANLPLGLPIRVSSGKYASLADLDFRIVGVAFRLRLLGGQCPGIAPEADRPIPSVDGAATVCAYEQLADGDWSLVVSKSDLALLNQLSIGACTGGSVGGATDEWCQNIDASGDTSSKSAALQGLPSGGRVRLEVGGTGGVPAQRRVVAARQVNVELGTLVDLPELRSTVSETIVAPNPECAVDEPACKAEVGTDEHWLCYPKSGTMLDDFLRAGWPLGLRISIGSARVVDVAVGGWSLRSSYWCPEFVSEGQGSQDLKSLALTSELVASLQETVKTGPLRVVFTFLEHDLLDRNIVSGSSLELTKLTFEDRDSGRLGFYNSVSLPTTLDGELCVDYAAFTEARPESIFLPLHRFALKDARELRPADLLALAASGFLATSSANRPAMAEDLDVQPHEEHRWLQFKRKLGGNAPRIFCAHVPRLEFTDTRNLSFQPVTLISQPRQDCSTPGACATLDPSPGNYWILLGRGLLGLGVNGGIYSRAQWPRHAVAAPALSLHMLLPFVEAGRHVGFGLRIPVVQVGLRVGISAPLRQGALEKADQGRTASLNFDPVGLYASLCTRSVSFSICGGAYATTSVDIYSDTPSSSGKGPLRFGFSLPIDWFAAMAF